MRRLKAAIALPLAFAMIAAIPSEAGAWSNSLSYKVSTNLTLTANVWLGTGCNGGFGWSASSVLTGSDPKTPNWIKVEFAAHVNGLLVTIYGVGGSTGSSDFTYSWTNSNGARGAYGSGWLELSNCITWISVDASTAASVYVYGLAKKIATATTKWW